MNMYWGEVGRINGRARLTLMSTRSVEMLANSTERRIFTYVELLTFCFGNVDCACYKIA